MSKLVIAILATALMIPIMLAASHVLPLGVPGALFGVPLTTWLCLLAFVVLVGLTAVAAWIDTGGAEQ